MEKKLQVKNLKISFRTSNGKVQAVRDVSFDLNKGETLAIVGESGSGKSVTSRAILGILANNSIIEDGEIFYDGQDLLKITEDDFHKIRGDKIAMIFQDPMSSLNPVVRIGKQLTEAMLLKNKASRRNSRRDFHEKMNLLLKCTNLAMGAQTNKEVSAANSAKVKKFNKFELKHIQLEASYNIAHEAAKEGLEDVEELILQIPKLAVVNIVKEVQSIVKKSVLAINPFVVINGEEMNALSTQLTELAELHKKDKLFDDIMPIAKQIKTLLDNALALEQPNFFALGYYLTFVDGVVPEKASIAQLNAEMRKVLDDEFMIDFIATMENGIKYSFQKSLEEKKNVVKLLSEQIAIFDKSGFTKKDANDAFKLMFKAVSLSLDRLQIIKDSLAYTFKSSLKSAIDNYFVAIKKNATEVVRFNKQTAKKNKAEARGKEVSWTVVPADVKDLDVMKDHIKRIINNLIAHYSKAEDNAEHYDANATAIDLIDFFKTMSSAMVYKVTPTMANNTALKLMEEVGIPEARKRFRQYSFQFSGGMRQRIVIAIALSANPDILICDEPTTALDVTIQAQILELINDLKRERHLSVIFITHDLGVVANMADRIAVMYAGKIVEYGTAEDVFYNPRHPYTWALLSSMPDLDTNEKLDAIPGTPPNMIYPPLGDAFAERNKYAMQIDFEEQPPMFQINETHYAATWLLHPDAPKVDPPKAVTDRIARMKKLGGASDGK